MLRHIKFANLHNFRDVGGYVGHGGRTVRWQRLYRADSLGWLAGDDIPAFRALRVRTVIDLRHPYEIEKRGRVPETEGLNYHNLPIEGRRWDFTLMRDDVTVARFLADRYLELSEDRADLLRTAVETVAEADNAPAVVHCAAGKDRTGILIALVLALAGVSDEDIVADYALTGLATERFMADWQTRHPDSFMWAGFGLAPAEAMSMFLTDISARHGSLAAYATGPLGIGQETVAEIRGHLLTDTAPEG
ncbi:tyrosine-protein phosphatase [Nonomuraea sp. NBC_01738]|uniref:tyrosine-protein phosphatase n=1 Tax=Nonomuraea sp. NBC_01738 TaxID=2976003 RepID=UPI002E0D3254|nr:tyrosine-protein phosphatase [Nonomuraea sp. NBC_01738]